MATKSANAKAPKYQMSWEEVYSRLHNNILRHLDITKNRVWGIPRGGTWVAAMSGLAIEEPIKADVFVDDIIDSGKTAAEYRTRFHKPILVIVDKQHNKEDAKLGWVVFPWEHIQQELKGPTNAVVRLLEFIGEDPLRDGLLETPNRVLNALEEMTFGYWSKPEDILEKRFPLDNDDMVIVSPIPFTSLCEHHLLPFSGVVHFGYIPSTHLVGLSKIPRLVLSFTQRLQTQERLTNEIASTFNELVKPIGVGVVVKAHHSCVGCRGVKQPTTNMITSAMLGVMRETPAARAEFLELIK